MKYEDIIEVVKEAGFERIERDDRLLDVLPYQTREKGVELWELVKNKDTYLLYLRLPYDAKRQRLYAMPSSELNEQLLQYEEMVLDELVPVATGVDVLEELKNLANK